MRHSIAMLTWALCILRSGGLSVPENKAHGTETAVVLSQPPADDGGHGDGHGEDTDGHGDAHGHEESTHEDAHGEAHGAAHGHGHHVTFDPVASSMAMMVFGNMAFGMTVFYFVNWPDKDVQKATWDAMNDCIAIFCAVLAFSAISTTLHDFAETDPHNHGPPHPHALAISFARYVVCIALLQLTFAFCKKKAWRFKYITTILGHVVGFAAIDFFGGAMQFGFFSHSLLTSWAAAIFFTVTMMGLSIGISTFTVDRSDGTHHWKAECKEVSSDYVALASGLLISLAIRMTISGELPPVHGSPRHKSVGMVWGLFTAGVLLVPVVLAVSQWKFNLHRANASRLVLRLSEAAQMISCFTAGWTLLYWGYWNFYQTAGDHDDDFGPGGQMLQRLTMAMIFSIVTFAAILVIDYIADHMDVPGLEYGFRSLLKTCSLVMGLSWEACFNQGVQAIGLRYHGQGHTETIVIVLLSVATCAVVLPAWALYIVPQTMEKDFAKEFLAEHHGHEHGHA